MHFTGLPLPGLPFHCQHQTAPVWVCSVSRNANHSFLDPCSTWQAPALHGKPALGYGSRGERSQGVLENPQGNRGHCSPCFQLCQAEWGRTGVLLQDPPQRVLHLPVAPSQQLPTPQKHQTNCESRESDRNSGSTASQTGSRYQHRTFQQLCLGDAEPNPTGSVLSRASHKCRS